MIVVCSMYFTLIQRISTTLSDNFQKNPLRFFELFNVGPAMNLRYIKFQHFLVIYYINFLLFPFNIARKTYKMKANGTCSREKGKSWEYTKRNHTITPRRVCHLRMTNN